jgi:hypothetical protein
MIVTSDGFGTDAGAVYNPVLEIEPLPLPPATVHVTAVLNVSVTVALNCSVFPITTFTPVGSTDTVTTFPAVPLLHPLSTTNATASNIATHRRAVDAHIPKAASRANKPALVIDSAGFMEVT